MSLNKVIGASSQNLGTSPYDLLNEQTALLTNLSAELSRIRTLLDREQLAKLPPVYDKPFYCPLPPYLVQQRTNRKQFEPTGGSMANIDWDRTPWNAGPGELSTDYSGDDERDAYEDETCGECGGDGYVENECFEDTCCCADPEAEHGIRTCPMCQGRGLHISTE